MVSLGITHTGTSLPDKGSLLRFKLTQACVLKLIELVEQLRLVHRAVVLEQTSRLWHRRRNLLLLTVLILAKLPIPGLHHFFNSHIFLHLELLSIALHQKDLLSINKLTFVTGLGSLDPLKLLICIGCHSGLFVIDCHLLLLLPLLDPLLAHSLFHLLGGVDVYLVLFDVPSSLFILGFDLFRNGEANMLIGKSLLSATDQVFPLRDDLVWVVL